MEGEGDNLGVAFVDRLQIGQHRLVANLAGSSGFKGSRQTVHELQFWTQLEERQIEVASYAKFSIEVGALQFDVVVVLATEVDHGVETSHEVGTVVVGARGCKDEVAGRRDVGRLGAVRGQRPQGQPI